jgi:hypothetical protein
VLKLVKKALYDSLVEGAPEGSCKSDRHSGWEVNMPVIGKIDLKTDKDVSTNAETSLVDLFSSTERYKEFTLDGDVAKSITKLKITAAKLASIDFTADVTKRKGDKTSLNAITRYIDISKKIKASQAINKGGTITINIETT